LGWVLILNPTQKPKSQVEVRKKPNLVYLTQSRIMVLVVFFNIYIKYKCTLGSFHILKLIYNRVPFCNKTDNK
jgi:hypothetical protein